MSRLDWPAAVVQCLCELKQDGLTFDTAWTMAVDLYPPRGRDLGEWRPTLLPEPGSAESVVEFMRRVAEDAWHGRNPSLRNFTVSAMVESEMDVAA